MTGLPRTVLNTPCRVLYRTERKKKIFKCPFSRFSHILQSVTRFNRFSVLSHGGYTVVNVLLWFFFVWEILPRPRPLAASKYRFVIYLPCDDHTTINPDVSRPVWPENWSQRGYILRKSPVAPSESRAMRPKFVDGYYYKYDDKTGTSHTGCPAACRLTSSSCLYLESHLFHNYFRWITKNNGLQIIFIKNSKTIYTVLPAA